MINNAGILRDKNLLRVTDDDWDAIIDIHLTAPFKLTRALFPVMKEQKYGKIINTSRFLFFMTYFKINFDSSAAGLYGNFGQVPYAAAKMGLVGLTKSIAIEGQVQKKFD